ncbi:hypothetical protein Tco_1401106 [Tanacetum coccineum]
MPLSNKTILDSHCFVHELKTEMHDDLEYVKSLEKEIDELESEKADFSNIYDLLLEEYLKAQMQDKNITISELKKLIENCKGKSVETQFNKPSVVRQPNAQRIPKPSVLGKPTPFSNSPEMRNFQTKQSVNKTNVSNDFLRRPYETESLSLKFNDLQCPTCKKCLYTANHDECVLEYLSKLNPRASAQNKDAKSHNTTKRYVPFEKISESKETRKTDSPKDIEHPSDTNVFTMKMEILLEPASNKLLVGDTVLDEKLNRGNIYGQNEFEWVAFKTNKSPMKSPVDEYDLVNAVGGAVPDADVFLQKVARVNAINIFGFQTLAHIILAKKLDMASIAHVLLKLIPTQDPRASMGPKEIDHIGGGVAATNFGVVRGLFGIAYWNKGCLGLLAEIVTYKGVVLDCISKQSERQGLDMTKLSSIHRTLTLFALSSMKE